MYVVQSILSASAAQQKTWLVSLCSCSGHISSLGDTNLIFALAGTLRPEGIGIFTVGGLGRVDRTPAGVFFKWPLAVAVDSGRYLRTASAVSPGHVEN